MKVIPVKEKGDIRIPADMRRALGLDEGGMVLIERDGDHLIVRPIRPRQHPEGFLGVFRDKVAKAGPVNCEVIEQAMVEESMERGDRSV